MLCQAFLYRQATKGTPELEETPKAYHQSSPTAAHVSDILLESYNGGPARRVDLPECRSVSGSHEDQLR